MVQNTGKQYIAFMYTNNSTVKVDQITPTKKNSVS